MKDTKLAVSLSDLFADLFDGNAKEVGLRVVEPFCLDISLDGLGCKRLLLQPLLGL
jgi:hypothetical protein